MKTLLLALLLIGAPAVFQSGCATATTSAAAKFRTFQDTWTVAHSAYAAWCERVVQGKVSKDQELAADRNWNRFRATFKTALTAAGQNWSAASPDNLNAASADLIKSLNP